MKTTRYFHLGLLLSIQLAASPLDLLFGLNRTDHSSEGVRISSSASSQASQKQTKKKEDKDANSYISDALKKNSFGSTRYREGLEILRNGYEVVKARGQVTFKIQYFLAKQYILILENEDLGQEESQKFIQNSLFHLKEASQQTGSGLSLSTGVDLRGSVSKLRRRLAQFQPQMLELPSSEFNILAAAALLEAGSRCEEDAIDVTHAIINRVNDPSFGSSVESVVFARGQFAAVDPIHPSQVRTRDGVIRAVQNLRGYSRTQASEKYRQYASALRNPGTMIDSRDHVAGLVFFKGESQYPYRYASDPLRRAGCNYFHTGSHESNQTRELRVEKAPLKIVTR